MILDRAFRQKPGKPGCIADSEGEIRAVTSRDEVLSVSNDPEGLGRGNASRPTREVQVLMN